MRKIIFNSMMRVQLILATLCVVTFASQAQSWTASSYGNMFTDTVFRKSNAAAVDASGNLYLAGVALNGAGAPFTRASIRKVSPTGTLVKQIYIDYYAADDIVDIKFINNAIYVIMNSQYMYSPYDWDAVIYKFDFSLNMIWSQSFNGTGDPDDKAIKIVAANSGSMHVLCQSGDSIAVIKLNGTNGSIMSTYKFKGPGPVIRSSGVDIKYKDNQTFVCGVAELTTNYSSTLLIKLDNNLIEQFAYHYWVSDTGLAIMKDMVAGMQIDSAGNIFIGGGYTKVGGAPASNAFLLKAYPNGLNSYLKKYPTRQQCVKVFMQSDGNPAMYTADNRLLRINNYSGNIYKNTSVLNNLSYSMHDAIMTSNNTLFTIGRVTVMQMYNGNLFPSEAIRVSKVTAAGTITNLKNNFYYTPTRADLTYSQGIIRSRNGTDVYYAYDVDDISLGSNEFFVNYGKLSGVGPREGGTVSMLTNFSVSAFPNPTIDKVTLNIPSEFENSELEVYNLEGKLLFSQIVNSLSPIVDISKQKNGIYLFKLINEKNCITQKVIKE
jgi:hypothetical protein